MTKIAFNRIIANNQKKIYTALKNAGQAVKERYYFVKYKKCASF